MDMKQSFAVIPNEKFYHMNCIKGYIKHNVPYNSRIKEDGNNILISINAPWWSWKIPYFAKENKRILKNVNQYIDQHRCIGVEYRVEFNMPLSYNGSTPASYPGNGDSSLPEGSKRKSCT